MNGMTAYSEIECDVAAGRLRLVIRTVNGRYFEPRLKLPSGLASLEEKVVGELRRTVRRGRVEFSLGWRQGGMSPRIDMRLAAEYLKQWRALASKLGLVGSPSPGDLMRLPGVFEVGEGGGRERAVWAGIRPALLACLREVAAMRGKEGEAIERELRRRLVRIGRLAASVRARERKAAAAKKRKLLVALEKYAGRGAREGGWEEVVRLVERMNIDEELERVTAHVAYFRECMRGSATGGKLDYITQELWREVNTIGSKVEEHAVRRLVVEMKEQLNKMREQLQNVE